MSIHDLIRAVIASEAQTTMGKVASEFYELEDVEGGYCWGCDVDIGQPMSYKDAYNRDQTTTVIRNVPIASNNREIFYAQVGWPVLLRRMSNSRFAIVGLGKSIKDVSQVTYVSFSERVNVVSRETLGYYYRRLTLGEMGTIEAFGTLPFGVIGIFNAADDSFVRIRT